MVGVALAAKQKALCVATRCTTAQQFIETFHRFCDEQSFFVATMNMRAVGLETPFSIQLADKTPMLRGLCVVLAAYTNASNPYKRPGIRLGIRRLTPESEAVFYQLQAMRTATPHQVTDEASEATDVPIAELPVPVKAPPIPTAARVSPPPRVPPPRPTPPAGAVPTVPAKTTPREPIKVEPPPLPVVEPSAPSTTAVEEQRTPGSSFVLPANPLSQVSDDAIGGFVDCTLYEETANFFRADAADDFEPEDPVVPPPPPAPLEVLPAFSPTAVIASAFPADVDLSGPTNVRPTSALAPLELPLPAPVETHSSMKAASTRVEPESSMKAANPRVEPESSMKAANPRVEPPVPMNLDSLDKGDTSRPIDEQRPTPMPAGEAYARQVVEARAGTRSKWLVIAGGAAAAIAAAIIVVATRSSDDTPAKPSAKPSDKASVVATAAPRPADPIDTPVTDAKVQGDVDVNGDDEATGDKLPGTPVVGDGPCRFDVNTTPAGTMVKVDGATMGPSPITVAGPCTKRRVELVHPRYKVEQRWVAPQAEKATALDVTLVRPTHNLLVTSNPAGATVYIAGRRAGTTPMKLPLMGFSGVEVKLEKRGFETVSKRVYSKVPEDKLAVTLKRALFIK